MGYIGQGQSGDQTGTAIPIAVLACLQKTPARRASQIPADWLFSRTGMPVDLHNLLSKLHPSFGWFFSGVHRLTLGTGAVLL